MYFILFFLLQKGSEVLGLSDLSMADQLYHYMVGGHKRPLVRHLNHILKHQLVMKRRF